MIKRNTKSTYIKFDTFQLNWKEAKALAILLGWFNKYWRDHRNGAKPLIEIKELEEKQQEFKKLLNSIAEKL